MLPNTVLHLGSNLGDRRSNLVHAIASLSQEIEIIQTSKYYCTQAWGQSNQPDFYNQAIAARTDMDAFELLEFCRKVGTQFPEKEGHQWGPRYIDIDLIFYEQQIIDTGLLKIPHPRMHLRNFVLIPLLEIAADWIHPIFEQTVEELFIACHDELEVILIETD